MVYSVFSFVPSDAASYIPMKCPYISDFLNSSVISLFIPLRYKHAVGVYVLYIGTVLVSLFFNLLNQISTPVKMDA